MTKREEYQHNLKPGDWIEACSIVDAIVPIYYERFDDEVRYDQTRQVGDPKGVFVVFRQFCYPDGRIKRSTPCCEPLSFVWPPTKAEMRLIEKVKAQNPGKFEQWLKKMRYPSDYKYFEYQVVKGTPQEAKERIEALFYSMEGNFTFEQWVEKGQAFDLGINLLDYMHYGNHACSPSISFDLTYSFGDIKGKEVHFNGLRFINLFEAED